MGVTLSAILIMGFIIIYAFLVQVYSMLFRLTGMTKEKSKFQSISILTGCGFTTRESELIAEDSRRRKIARAAMITSYVFSVVIVSLVINLLVTLKNEQTQDTLYIILIVFGSMIVFFLFTKIPFVNKGIEKLIEVLALGVLKSRNRENQITLLDNFGKTAICEIYINKLPKFLEHKSLIESSLKDTYSLNVLMIKRNKHVIEVTKDTVIQNKDVIVIFGNYQNIKDIFSSKNMKNNEEIVKEASKDNSIELIDNYGADAMAEITINKLPEFMIGKKLFENKLKEVYQINILTIKRDEEAIDVLADTIIEEGDKIVVFGPYKNIKNIFLYNQYKENA